MILKLPAASSWGQRSRFGSIDFVMFSCKTGSFRVALLNPRRNPFDHDRVYINLPRDPSFFILSKLVIYLAIPRFIYNILQMHNLVNERRFINAGG